jgi:cell division protein FtsQ
VSPARVAERPVVAGGPARPSRTRLLVAAGAALAVLVGAVWVVGFTGVLGVRTVTVTGVTALSADQVRAAAAVEDGRPLARVDLGAVGDRVRALAGVERVAVARSWPGTIRITVTERHGVALVNRSGGWWLVDPAGVVFQQVPRRLRLPVLAVADVGPDNAAARAALTALTALPPAITGQVAKVAAPTPEQVTLYLSAERDVLWGGAEDSAAKAAVLTALLRRPGRHYDVSTPSVVTVR